MKKIYISIPITGTDYNDQRSHVSTVAEKLVEKGYEVITPFDIIKSVTTPYCVAMGRCIEALLECDMVYLCNGWQKSKGCNAELQIALVYGKDVITE